MNQKNQTSSTFNYFIIAGALLLFRAKIADKVFEIFEKYYWNAIYHVDMLCIAICMWGLSTACKQRWKKVTIESYVGFIIGDFVDRVFLKNTFATKIDMLGLALAILIPLIKYLIEDGRKSRRNMGKD